jgi:hypothetical protein
MKCGACRQHQCIIYQIGKEKCNHASLSCCWCSTCRSGTSADRRKTRRFNHYKTSLSHKSRRRPQTHIRKSGAFGTQTVPWNQVSAEIYMQQAEWTGGGAVSRLITDSVQPYPRKRKSQILVHQHQCGCSRLCMRACRLSLELAVSRMGCFESRRAQDPGCQQ